MRRVLQVCGVAAVLASLGCAYVPVAGAQGIVSGVTLPPISAVTPGMPIGVNVSVPNLVSSPVMPGMSAGMAATGSGGQREVTYEESKTSEPATIVLGE
ncbi:MAG: hypothetical protein R2853_14925 [Thermomicrobiales bacterium]|nr:hypothetical protein [Thermomicrobiales bacterium]